MPDPVSWILRNATTRPVELHRPEGVVVLPPRGTICVSGADPALDALERRGVLTRHAAHPPPPETAAEDAPAEDAPSAGTGPAAEDADGARPDAGAASSRRTRESSRHPDGEPA